MASDPAAAIVCPKCGRMCWRVMTGGPACVERRPACGRRRSERPTLSERLFNVADGGCACGGRYKPTGAAQIRCDRCDRHRGYGIQPRLLDLIREAAEVVKRHA